MADIPNLDDPIEDQPAVETEMIADLRKKHLATANKLKDFELKDRDHKVAYYYLRGHTYAQIAQLVGVKSASSIGESVRRCIAFYKASMFESMSDWVALELEKLAHIEQEAWAEWEKSKQLRIKERHKAERVMSESDGEILVGLVPTEDTIEEQAGLGDTKYLDLVIKAHEKRVKLLGLEAPVRLALTEETDAQKFNDNARQLLLSKLVPELADPGEADSAEPAE